MTLIDAALVSRPECTELHLQRASLLEDSGRIEEAAAEYEHAEVVANSTGQPALDRGLFLYRQGHWEKARMCLDQFGAEAICSPLHPRYLVCLFNLGEYARCHALVERWQKIRPRI